MLVVNGWELKVYSFIVLGLIPGTNIQIGFWAWIALTILFFIGFRIYKGRLTTIISGWWHQFDDENYLLSRTTLHASQLHRRLHRAAR